MFRKLLDWLRSLLRPKAVLRDRYDLYRPEDRLIYSYFNGKEIVQADPMVVYRKVTAVSADLSMDIKLSNSLLLPADQKMQAHGKMLEKIRKIFDVKPFEEGGLTQTETSDLFDHFMIFCEVQKKTGREPPTSPGETSASTSPPTPDSPGGSSSASLPIPNTSDSGSTGTGPSTAPPPPSLSEPASPAGASSPDSVTTRA